MLMHNSEPDIRLVFERSQEGDGPSQAMLNDLAYTGHREAGSLIDELAKECALRTGIDYSLAVRKVFAAHPALHEAYLNAPGRK